jgi:hypothetical protein
MFANDPNAYTIAVSPPRGPAWTSARDSQRLRYWQEVGRLGAAAKQEELAAGKGVDGRALRRIADSTRKRRALFDYSPMGTASPNAPPLTPCYSASRTRSLLRWEATARGCLFGWASDIHTGRPWGEILRYHADGSAHLPVRDVIGLSAGATRKVARQALAWWVRTGVKHPFAASAPQEAPIHGASGGKAARGFIGPSGTRLPKPPIADYSTGFRQFKDAAFTPIDVRGKHIDGIVRMQGGL